VKKKILVTGSAGFIGGELVQRLLKEGHEVIGLDILKNSELPIDQYVVDLRAKQILDEDLWKEIEYVFHLAAVANINFAREHPDETFAINTLGTYNMAKNCLKYKIPLLYVSTCAVYGATKDIPRTELSLPEPTEIYAQTKFAAETFAKMPIQWVIPRFSTVYGPTMRSALATHIFLTKAVNSEKITLSGDGKQRRTWIYIDDLIEATYKIYDGKIFNEIINLGANESPSVKDLARWCYQVVHGETTRIPIEYGPARPGEVDEVISIEKAKRLLHWIPQYKLKAGLKKVYKEWK